MAWMRDQLIAQVPTTAEQVHVRQILLYSSDQANEVLAQLKAGKDFAALAAQYDPLTFGDLGWSPRHYLLDPKIEEAVFSLQPGQSSDVIQTSAGFHIIQVIERESQRPLDSNALLALQLQALDNWLQERRNQSQIQFLLP
jgi:peptidyl-prolyl cis-trans isomerase C